MAVTTIVLWGLVLDPAFEAPWENEPWEGDAEGFYVEKMGVKRPPQLYLTEDAETKTEFKKYWEERKTALADAGCTVGIHFAHENPRYYVAVVESELMSYGDPIELGSLAVGADWQERLKEYCTVMKLPWSEPKWWSVCYWGYPKDEQVGTAAAAPENEDDEDED